MVCIICIEVYILRYLHCFRHLAQCHVKGERSECTGIYKWVFIRNDCDMCLYNCLISLDSFIDSTRNQIHSSYLKIMFLITC